ncbi:MAG TPA: hypothetical protein VKE98_24890 [Gemmataceae bacterium]|nr:hypothetical protein [Gemmataceae bacterium]
MKSRVLLAFLGLAAVTFVLARAQEPNQPKKNDNKGTQIADDAALKEQILARQFAEFEQSLLRLKQRLERSPKREDQERAKILQKALDECRSAGLGTQFEQMVDLLKKQGLKNVGDTKAAYERSTKLAEDLRRIVALLREDTKAALLREEKLTLEKTIKEIEKLILKQKIIQGQNDVGKTEKIELALNQNKVSKETADLAKKMAGGKGDPNDMKGKAKDGKAKGDSKAGEAKNVGKHGEKSEAKAGGKGSESKPGEAKAGAKGSKGSEAKPAESKSGSKGGDAKSGQSKSGKGSKGGEAKDSKSGNGKEGEKKEGNAKDAGKDADGSKIKEKQGEAKTGEKKEGENKQGEAKSGSKSGDSKQADSKGSKAGDSKSGESKSGAQSKQGEAKSGSPSSGQGQSKSGGSKSGKQPDSKGDNAKKGGNDAPPPTASGKKQVEDANYKQKQAEENIAKENKKGASDDMGKAIDDLEKAKKKLEDLLNQIREEELERLLAALQARCEKMLAMQIQVLAGTEGVFKAIESHKDKKPARADQQESLKLSDQEKEIVVEATKAIEMLEAEGSAVAFPEVFKQVREDMKHVQRRLGIVDTGVVTQAIEKDIIDTLKEMIEALKKAKQELSDKKSPPSNSPPPQPQDQKLLDQIAELKMIRSMQIRVNSRTTIYGKQYNGEQAGEPAIVRELRNLSERQERIFEVTNRIAKGDNK